MNIRYFSDIHLEFHDRHNQMNVVDRLIGGDTPDVIVCAGDLDVGGDTIKWLEYIDKEVKCPFLFVPGNHEYYGTQKSYMDDQFRRVQKNFKNVHILLRDTFKYQDVTFAGTTGWWDVPMGINHIRSLNDFNRIYDIKENNNGTDWGIRDRLWFRDTLENTEKVVCISHNAPTHKCVLPQYKGSDINECFANHWDKMIIENTPLAWIHGHMHNTIDTIVGKTVVICNPFGYDRYEVNKEFKWDQEINV